MIDNFTGKYHFLSNFHNSPVEYEGLIYLNSEAAFQAAKVLDEGTRKEFTRLNPSEAKRKGRHVNLRSDWEDVKYDVMLTIVRNKFSQNRDLQERLIATGNENLVEGNTWGDRTWGVVDGVGKNWLGKILMQVRGELGSI